MHHRAMFAAKAVVAAAALSVHRGNSDYSWDHFMDYAGGDGLSADYYWRAVFVLFSSAS